VKQTYILTRAAWAQDYLKPLHIWQGIVKKAATAVNESKKQSQGLASPDTVSALAAAKGARDTKFIEIGQKVPSLCNSQPDHELAEMLRSSEQLQGLLATSPLKHLERAVGTQYTGIEARLLTSHKVIGIARIKLQIEGNLNELLSERATYDETLHDEEWLQDCNEQIAEQDSEEEVAAELAEEEPNGCLNALAVEVSMANAL
jgi:hypothetical protein